MNYPNLSKEKAIGLDIETHDPKLKTLGNGVYRKDGKVLGFSVATKGGFKEYYNLGHYDCLPEEKQKNLNYLKEVCKTNADKVGARLNYDFDWIENFLKIKIKGTIRDVQVAEALIDENTRKYNLDFLAYKYLFQKKEKNEIDQFCIDNDLKGDSRNWLYKMPCALVSKYGKADAKLPLDILDKQMSILEDEELLDVFELESKLLRCLLLMKKTGVLIDTEKRDRNALALQNYLEERRIKLFDKFGEFNYNSGQQIAKQLDKLDIPYSLTEKGNPNIDRYFFEANKESHSFVKTVHELRKADKTLNTFLLGSLYRFLVDNKIHCDFYNTRTEDFGTRSGRFSSANPNLQQIPSLGTNEFLGNLCREVFIPFPGCWWGKIDYSQIEYRFIAHFASGEGAEILRQTYIDNPNTDYHQYIMDLTKLDRKKSKNLNFGVGYGMGAPFMSKFFGWELDYCFDILATYHRKAPYIKTTLLLILVLNEQTLYMLF